MNTFACIALLAACALAAPTPEPGRRDKRSGWHGELVPGAYSLPAPLVSHAALYSAPTAVIHEPAVVSIKKIVNVPEVVSVRKVVSYPYVSRVSHYVAPTVTRLAHYRAPLVTRVAHYTVPRVSYAPAYSTGWW